MPSIKTHFLLIGSWDPRLKEIGAALAPTLSEAIDLKENSFEVVGVTATALMEKKFLSYWNLLRQVNPGLQLVAAFPEEFPVATLMNLHHEYHFFRLLKNTRLDEAEPVFYEAQEAVSRWRQDLAMESLLKEQEGRLEALRGELENRVERRTHLLAESRHNLNVRSQRLEALRKALLAIQESASLSEMEKSLNESLSGTVETSWIRIVAAPQDEEFARQITQMDGFAWRVVPLWRHQERIGSAFYMRPKDRPFRREDHDFLDKISEALALASDRLVKLREAESLKEQWEATFAAISDTVAIIDRSYEIVQSNTPEATGTACHEKFFGRSSPCPGCRRGESFILDEGGRLYEVHSQLLAVDPQSEPAYVNIYTDVTERRRMERRILESAKMAELGTIGSSIAHELNNPLGGVLNFTQLLRMDLPKDHPFSEDLKEIEAGAQRCKEIVENLLGFTRAPRADEMREVDLREVVERAIKIEELRTKSMGLEVRFKKPDEIFLIRGHLNLLSQAFKNVLERSIDSVLAKRHLSPTAKGSIEIEIKSAIVDERKVFILTIRDDGHWDAAVAGRHGLPLQMASQILRDQDAGLEIAAPSSPASWAKISFSRPVLRS